VDCKDLSCDGAILIKISGEPHLRRNHPIQITRNGIRISVLANHLVHLKRISVVFVASLREFGYPNGVPLMQQQTFYLIASSSDDIGFKEVRLKGRLIGRTLSYQNKRAMSPLAQSGLRRAQMRSPLPALKRILPPRNHLPANTVLPPRHDGQNIRHRVKLCSQKYSYLRKSEIVI